jgi:SM-20-related protein
MSAQFEELVDSFIGNRVGISEHFLSEKLAAGLQQNLYNLSDDAKLFPAGIGNHAVLDATQQLRGDRICWIEPDTTNVFEQEFLTQVDDFVAYLNRTCYTGINAYEFHYALYEEGSFYKKHKDQFQNNDHRKYSLISYLNNDWIAADGGQLGIHHETEAVQHILPTNRKAVFFQSDEIMHEVTLAHRPRMSITGWLKRV